MEYFNLYSSTSRKWDFADPFDKLWLILLPPEYNFVNDITKLAHTKVVILIIAERSGLLLWAPNGKIMAITRAHVRDTTNQVDVNWKSSIIMEFVSQRNWLFCGYKLYIDFFLFFLSLRRRKYTDVYGITYHEKIVDECKVWFRQTYRVIKY